MLKDEWKEGALTRLGVLTRDIRQSLLGRVRDEIVGSR